MLTRRLTCHLRAKMLCKMLAALIWQLCISLPARLAPHATSPPPSPTPDESEYKINICPPYMFVTYRLAPRSFSHIYFHFFFASLQHFCSKWCWGHIMILCMTKYKILLQSLLSRNKRSRISNLWKFLPNFVVYSRHNILCKYVLINRACKTKYVKYNIFFISHFKNISNILVFFEFYWKYL